MPKHKTYRIGNRLECLDRDLEGSDRKTVSQQIRELGAGWRIPEVPEYRLMKSLHELGVGGFRTEWHPWPDGTEERLWYMTTMPCRDPQRPFYAFSFTEDLSGWGYPAENHILVRPVRDL